MKTRHDQQTHLESVMGTIVGFSSPDRLGEEALSAAVAVLREADRVFSTWDPDSPMSRIRSGHAEIDAFDPGDSSRITEVLIRCELAREITGGAFDPWAMPGGVDPTGLVKGWAAERALETLVAGGTRNAMINAGGDIAVSGSKLRRPWTVGIRHPGQPVDLAAVIEVEAAVATSGPYERPGQLTDPATGRTARGIASATVTGPHLDLADALATGLAVGGRPVLEAIDGFPGYEAYMISEDGRHYATPGMAFVEQHEPVR